MLWWLAGEDLSKEEHVDNEFLWNLKLLSEVHNVLHSLHCTMLWCYEYFRLVRRVRFFCCQLMAKPACCFFQSCLAGLFWSCWKELLEWLVWVMIPWCKQKVCVIHTHDTYAVSVTWYTCAHWYCIRTSEHMELILTTESTVEMSCIVLSEDRGVSKNNGTSHRSLFSAEEIAN